MANRSSTVSLRLSESERSQLRSVAARLDVREADVLRYALEISLSRLGPLLDPEACGVELLPLFVETGDELLRYFHLDAEQLDRIINGGTDEPCRRVDTKDLQMLTRTWQEQPSAVIQLKALLGETDQQEADLRHLRRQLKNYLYDKYIYRPVVTETASAQELAVVPGDSPQ